MFIFPFSHFKEGSGGGGEPSTFNGFKIKVPYGSWVGFVGIQITDHNDNEFFTALTALTETQATTYAAVSAGEFATDSTYSGDNTRMFLNDTDPDITDSAAPTGSVEWSTGASSGLEVYIKPSTNKSIKLIDIALTNAYGDVISTIAFTDGSDTTLTPSISPSDINDTYQTTIANSYNWYQWTFPENP